MREVMGLSDAGRGARSRVSLFPGRKTPTSDGAKKARTLTPLRAR